MCQVRMPRGEYYDMVMIHVKICEEPLDVWQQLECAWDSMLEGQTMYISNDH